MGCCFAGVRRLSPASALPAMAPLVVRRDGREREFALLPEGIASERLLLTSQPRRHRAPRRSAQVPGHRQAAA